MAAIDDLETQVAQNTSVEASAVTLIKGIAAELEAAIQAQDGERLNAVLAKLKSSADTLGAAVAANTPAASDPSNTAAVALAGRRALAGSDPNAGPPEVAHNNVGPGNYTLQGQGGNIVDVAKIRSTPLNQAPGYPPALANPPAARDPEANPPKEINAELKGRGLRDKDGNLTRPVGGAGLEPNRSMPLPEGTDPKNPGAFPEGVQVGDRRGELTDPHASARSLFAPQGAELGQGVHGPDGNHGAPDDGSTMTKSSTGEKGPGEKAADKASDKKVETPAADKKGSSSK